jgi:hypothetical protein
MIDPKTALSLRLVLVAPLLLLTPIFAYAMVSPGVFRSLFDSRGTAEEEGTTTTYRVKPIVRVFLGFLGLIYIAIVWSGCRDFGLGGWSKFIVLGFLVVDLFLTLRSPNRIVLDGRACIATI